MGPNGRCSASLHSRYVGRPSPASRLLRHTYSPFVLPLAFVFIFSPTAQDGEALKTEEVTKLSAIILTSRFICVARYRHSLVTLHFIFQPSDTLTVVYAISNNVFLLLVLYIARCCHFLWTSRFNLKAQWHGHIPLQATKSSKDAIKVSATTTFSHSSNLLSTITLSFLSFFESDL
jgi:hypothetical protein